MQRIIKAMEDKYRAPALDMVEAVFAVHDSPEEGRFVRRLIGEIRSKRYYIPELELVPGALESIRGAVDHGFYDT